MDSTQITPSSNVHQPHTNYQHTVLPQLLTAPNSLSQSSDFLQVWNTNFGSSIQQYTDVLHSPSYRSSYIQHITPAIFPANPMEYVINALFADP